MHGRQLVYFRLNPLDGVGRPGILPFAFPVELKAAIAMATFSNLVDKTDSAIFAIQNVVRIYAKSHRPEENQDGGTFALHVRFR